MITIVDYNVGNLGSIRNMLKKIGFESRITSDPEHESHVLHAVVAEHEGEARTRASRKALVHARQGKHPACVRHDLGWP